MTSMTIDLPALWRQYQTAVVEHEANDLEPRTIPRGSGISMPCMPSRPRGRPI